ncbi:MAG: hypothetical protein JW955_23180 [Sedimentisphaerales bacterium]|nr:hypothetical protein [Sedimentisphaerales bacterium]
MHIQSASVARAAERAIPKTGPQIIVDALLAHGADTVFGYIGESVLPLFDRLHEAPIQFIVPCHEQGGCHTADAYARASGRTGVVIATSGPGACNLVTGLATAMMDSIPLVAITGQVRTDLIGDDAFQEAPTAGITRAVGAVGIKVESKEQVGPAIEQALREDRPCVVDFHVDAEEKALPMVPPGKGLHEMEGLRVLQNAM